MQELNPKKRESSAAKPRAPRVSDKPKSTKPARFPKKDPQPTLFADEATAEPREKEMPKPSKGAASSGQNGFRQFGLHESLLAALDAKGMTVPNDIQKQLLPPAVVGRDIATTIPQGNGKTAFFLMVAAQRLLSGEVARGTAKAPAVLILVNDKDAALKGQSHAGRLLGDSGLTATAIFENGDVQRQEGALQQGVDIVFATPARALEFSSKGSLEWSSLSMLFIDDLSDLLKAGASSDTEYLLKSLIKKRLQSIFQSTWWNSWSQKMAETYLLKPQSLNVKKGAEPRFVNIQHTVYVVAAEQKFQVLLGTLRNERKFTVVFVNTKIVADWVGYKLAANGAKVEICLNPPSPDRKADIVKAVEEGKLHTLVVVEGALSDMKFTKTPNVINFDVPDTIDAFLKRAELTKSQTPAQYFTIVCDDYGHNMVNIEAELEQSLAAKEVPADYLKIEDKSDFPFDETGRVKAIPNNLRVIAAPVPPPAPTPATTPAPAAQKPAFQPKPIERVAAESMPTVPLVASDAPQPPAYQDGRRPHHQASPQGAVGGAPQQPQQYRQNQAQQPNQRPRDRDMGAGAGAGGYAEQPQQPRQQPQGQKPYSPRQSSGSSPYPANGQGQQPYRQQREERFDERARESAEAAREAARQAASAANQGAVHKHKPKSVGYERPEGGIVDLATETFHTAVELVQLRVMEAVEDAFVPPLSRLLERLRAARDRRLRR